MFASTISRSFTHCPVHFYVTMNTPPFPVHSHTVRCLPPPFPVHSHTVRSTSMLASTISRSFTHCPVHFYVTMNTLHHFPSIHTLSGPLLCHYEHSTISRPFTHCPVHFYVTMNTPPFPVHSHTVLCLPPPFPVHSHTVRSTSMFVSTISRSFTHCPVHFYVTMHTLHQFPSIHTLSGPLLCLPPPFPVHSHTVRSTSMSL